MRDLTSFSYSPSLAARSATAPLPIFYRVSMRPHRPRTNPMEGELSQSVFPDLDLVRHQKKHRDLSNNLLAYEMNPRFHTLESGGDAIAHDYGVIYFREPCGDSERLVLGASKKQIALLDKLSASFPSEQTYALYVLLVSHLGHSRGRYQSPLFQTHEDLQVFLYTFQEYFESDGRHHLWIGTPDGSAMLVFDQHDVIFAYGDLNTYEKILIKEGYTPKEFWFPSPHGHSYNPENDKYEDEIIGHFDWVRTDLQGRDEWG